MSADNLSGQASVGPEDGGSEVLASELCAVAVRAARMAGELLLERFVGGPERSVTSKTTPTDLVSEADLTSERAIRQLLGEYRPDDGILGEEGGDEEGSSGLRWVVDPLDATVNFLFGIPHWCVSVAVEDRHGTIAGAVFDPNRGELFTAVRDGPARIRTLDGGADVERAPRTVVAVDKGGPLSEAMVATGLAYDAAVRNAQAKVLANLAPRIRDIRRFGSAALDLTWTAIGRYDAYFERTVMPWDIAAGALFCRCAGLEVVDLPAREGLPLGILVAPPSLIGPLRELVDRD